MLRSDMHGQWPSDADALHRQLCAEMLDHLAARGGGAPYPFGDALYLLEAARPAGRGPAPAGLLRRVARALTRRMEHPRMARTFVEGSSSGGRSEQLPLRGVPA
jgi:hypothetical protein